MFIYALLIPLASTVSVWGSNPPAPATDWVYDDDEYFMANINITYYDSTNMLMVTERGELGKFGAGKVDRVEGKLVHIRNFGCDRPFGNVPSEGKWIALVRRGRCYFDDKVESALLSNASALIVYNSRDDGLQRMSVKTKLREQIVSVFISKSRGEHLAEILGNGTTVNIAIIPGTKHFDEYPTRTSVMFVSISFIVLMMISLAWLIFYYVQRFRYLHARDQLTRQMMTAAQRAVSKIPTKTVKGIETELGEGECCAVCIEPFKANDLVRILPCKHEFHKLCIDPWIVDHRTCPMCKMDVLKHYGYVFAGSQESIVNMDLDTPIVPTRLGRHLSGGSGTSSPGVLSRSRTPEPQLGISTNGGRLRPPRSLGQEGRWTWGRGFIWGRSEDVSINPSAEPQSQSAIEGRCSRHGPTVVVPASPDCAGCSHLVIPSISVIDSSSPVTVTESSSITPVSVISRSLHLPTTKCVSVRTL